MAGEVLDLVVAFYEASSPWTPFSNLTFRELGACPRLGVGTYENLFDLAFGQVGENLAINLSRTDHGVLAPTVEFSFVQKAVTNIRVLETQGPLPTAAPTPSPTAAPTVAPSASPSTSSVELSDCLLAQDVLTHQLNVYLGMMILVLTLLMSLLIVFTLLLRKWPVTEALPSSNPLH